MPAARYVRSGAAVTLPELIARSGPGRKLVTQRLGELLACGLLIEDGLAPSTGGRAPRRLRFGAPVIAQLVAADEDTYAM
ncbi:hypothetical protein [Actinophytocola sp.]|uniref:hypothetical protein n=1 Tax=Actinophytocola sp. TaxID=1872138 RepID=UPI00389A9146